MEKCFLLCKKNDYQFEEQKKGILSHFSSLKKYNGEKYIFVKYMSEKETEKKYYAVYFNDDENSNSVVLNSISDKEEIHSLCFSCQMLLDDIKHNTKFEESYSKNFPFELICYQFDCNNPVHQTLILQAEGILKANKES